MKEVDFNPHGCLLGAQDFSSGSHCRCDRNSNRYRNEAWRCDWTAAILWLSFNEWRVASYECIKKVILEMISTPDSVKITGMTTQDSDYYTNLTDKAVNYLEFWMKCYCE